MTAPGLGRVEKKADICWVDWWFDFSEHVDELFDLVLRWRNRLSCSSDVRLKRGTKLQPAASRLSIWFTHRLNSGPGSCDLLCKGLGLPEYLPRALPVVTGAPDPLASLEGLWTLWDETTAESLELYIWNAGVVFLLLFFFVCLFFTGFPWSTENIQVKRDKFNKEVTENPKTQLGESVQFY